MGVMKELIEDKSDVVIMGGGLAGLSLAIQLKNKAPDASIMVIEKARFPRPEAALKVGESTVEVGSHYFEKILGLKNILDQEIRKLGLRFFFTRDDNRDITLRTELGPSHFLTVWSYQLDRGRFENALAKHCENLGINLISEASVRDLELAKNDSRVLFKKRGETHSLKAKWLVDASGRASLLKRKLGLAKSIKHNINAAWFRIAAKINVDDWSTDVEWQKRNELTRYASTNHLYGKGYWTWLIALSSGSTSIGIVADERIHPFNTINTFDKAREWLKNYEPQCSDRIEEKIDLFQDFLCLKHFSYRCKQLYSEDGWCLTGDAGMFLDPLYSPGSDFVGMNNGFITDIISKFLQGQNISQEVHEHERTFRSIFSGFTPIYEDQYSTMANSKVMSSKFVWDLMMYWGGIAPLFFNQKLTDIEFMNFARPILFDFFNLNVRMQDLYRAWTLLDDDQQHPAGIFLDYAELPLIKQLNRDLLVLKEDEKLLKQLRENLKSAGELADEIYSEAIKDYSELKDENVSTSSSSIAHLKGFYNEFTVC